ncbi:hypothetical protein ElyMa_006294400 [Elysia marginata]|uniref:Receptor ligand binding region domain-containing protein n=1 Tax=Elysia marginata TaxID=1093978 RepID=A0AAV4HDJ2_9GAST|nr:hypothetical protein ElyMa_006294400 [Elysia marginata]
MVDSCCTGDLCFEGVRKSTFPRLNQVLVFRDSQETNTHNSECIGNFCGPGQSRMVHSVEHGREDDKYLGLEQGNGKRLPRLHCCPCQYYLYETEFVNQEDRSSITERNSEWHTKAGTFLQETWLYITRTIQPRRVSNAVILQPNIPCHHYRQNPLSSRSNNRRCNEAAFLFFLLVFMSSTLTLLPRVVSTQTTPQTQLDLNLGILVAESCANNFITSAEETAQSAINAFYALVNATDSTAGSSSPAVLVSARTYPYCGTKEIIASLDPILNNATVDVVLALTNYDVHASFLPLAEIYEKAYVALNVFLPTASFDQSASIFPSFSQMALMLAKLLDTYKWQNVFVVQTKLNKWDDFTNIFFFKMSSLDFQVTLGTILTPSTDEANARTVLAQVESKHKVSLLVITSETFSSSKCPSLCKHLGTSKKKTKQPSIVVRKQKTKNLLEKDDTGHFRGSQDSPGLPEE